MNVYWLVFLSILVLFWIAEGFLWLTRTFRLFASGPMLLKSFVPPNISFLIASGWLFTLTAGFVHNYQQYEQNWRYLGIIALTSLVGLATLLIFLDDLFDFLPYRNSQTNQPVLTVAGLDGEGTREVVSQALEQLHVKTANFGLHALQDELDEETFQQISEAEIFSGPGIPPVALPGMEAVITFSSEKGRTKLFLWEQQTYRKLSFTELLPELGSTLSTETKAVEPDPTFTKRAILFLGLRGSLQVLTGCGLLTGFYWWFW